MNKLLMFIFAALLPAQAFSLSLKPINNNSSEAALIIVPGAQMKASQYEKIARQIQQATKLRLWVAIPDIPLGLASNLTLKAPVENIIEEIRGQGFSADKIVLAGHSLGGAAAQELFLEKSDFDSLILMASFVSRKNRLKLTDSPVLTVAGELDGLTRVSRIAESFYHEILSKKDQYQIRSKHPIAVVEGMNHMQFASGHKPILVRKRDLKAEISESQAHEKVASLVASFLENRIIPSEKTAKSLLQASSRAESLLRPIVKSMELEGSYHLKKTCADSSLKKGEDCWKGSPWAEFALHWFAGDAGPRIESRNEFHEVWRIFPFFHPKIENTCGLSDNKCKLKVKSIAQATYETISKLDTGFNSNSATDIRIKFKSRQAMFSALGNKELRFEETDKKNWCKRLNQKAIDWAEDNASKKALSRYKTSGIEMQVGDDFKNVQTGPAWIWKALSQKTVVNASGKTVRLVRSAVMKTSLDYPIAKAQGMHYCKLLSPARALEWIYIDSLRKN